MVPRHLRATGMSGSCWERPRGGGEVIPGKALASWKSYADKLENGREQVKRSRAESWGGSEARLGLWVLGTHHWKRKPHGLTRQPQKETSSRGGRPCPPSAFPASGSPPRALGGGHGHVCQGHREFRPPAALQAPARGLDGSRGSSRDREVILIPVS